MADSTIRPNAATVQFDQLFDNCQAETGTDCRTATRTVGAIVFSPAGQGAINGLTLHTKNVAASASKVK